MDIAIFLKMCSHLVCFRKMYKDWYAISICYSSSGPLSISNKLDHRFVGNPVQNEIWLLVIGFSCNCVSDIMYLSHEPPHEKKNNKKTCEPSEEVSLGIHPAWSESSQSTWRKLGSSATHWKHCKDSDQTGRMPRLTWLCWAHIPFCLNFVMMWLTRDLIWTLQTDRSCYNINKIESAAFWI